jgi:hypothetical protein
MAEPSIKGFFDFWGSKLTGLKDMAKTAYNEAKYQVIKPNRPLNPLVSDPSRNTIPVATNTPTPTPSAYPTLAPGYEFTVKDKPPIPPNLLEMVNRAATNQELDPKVSAGLLAQETGGYNYDLPESKRIGLSGERGITQIIPKWHYKEAGYKTPEEYGLALDNGDEFAIKESARILKKYYTGRKSIFDALREYNAGGSLVSGTQYAIQILKRVGLEDEIPEEYKELVKSSNKEK